MALSKPETTVYEKEGLQILTDSSEIFEATLFKFRVVRDLCHVSATSGLKAETLRLVEQTSLDFRHICEQTSRLSEAVASVWCAKCLLLFKNLDQIKGSPQKILASISNEAKDLSDGFKIIKKWINELSGRFHDCEQFSKKDVKVYREALGKIFQDAERASKAAEKKRKDATAEAERASKSASKWGLALMIPFVNILIALPAYIVRKHQSLDARAKELAAVAAFTEANQALQQVTTSREQATIAAGHIAELVALLKQVESICEGQASFWECQSNKFSSYSATVLSAQDFIDSGLGDAAVADMVKWLERRKEELECYHVAMLRINNSFNFTTSLTPHPLPPVPLPSLNITLH